MLRCSPCLYNTGARVSEIIRLRVADILLERTRVVHLHGKGRKERVIPLWKSTVAQLRAWFERIDLWHEVPVFPNRAGKPASTEEGLEKAPAERHAAMSLKRSA